MVGAVGVVGSNGQPCFDDRPRCRCSRTAGARPEARVGRVQDIIDGIVDAILVDTAEIGAAGAGLTEAGGTGDQLTALATQAKQDVIDGIVDAIKVEIDKLTTTAHAEPTGVPAANESPIEKLGYLFMALRNQVDVTATKKTFYGDDGIAEWEKDLSDNGTTYSESEGNVI